MDNLAAEFDRQLQTLLQKGYPKATGYSEIDFVKKIQPLGNYLNSLTLPDIDLENGTLPFVIVVTNELIPTDKAMFLVERKGKEGKVKLFPHKPSDFQTISEVVIPKSQAYLLIDIDRGRETLNLPPNQALTLIQKQRRSPLTIDEGVAIVTHFPEFLLKNNCFSLLASRYSGDKRVPAIWINAAKNPNLGWCWAGNPHTWLGSASCRERIGLTSD